MNTFIGEYTVKLDIKSRFVLPAAYIKQLNGIASNEIFVLKEDLHEKCLTLYPYNEWDRQNQIIRNKVNPFDREHNQFLRSFSKGAVEVSLDCINRILVPKRLIDYAMLKRDIVLLGQDRKIEIWSAEVYRQLLDNNTDFEKLAKKIFNT